MLTKIFAVWDQKAEAYMQPFFVQTAGMALRHFADNVNNQDTIFWKHPDDFVLYELGEFNDSNGELLKHEMPKHLGTATEYIERDDELRAVS